MSIDKHHDWNAYHRSATSLTPRKLLIQTLNYCSDFHGSKALDLGCGNGRDTTALLDAGFHVTAIDSCTDALTVMEEQHRDAITAGELSVHEESFDSHTFEAKHYHLINAAYSLPFSSNLVRLWYSLTNSLVIEGMFCGQFFGERDSWCKRNDVTTLNISQLDHLLGPFSVLRFAEDEYDGSTATGIEKHWHIFHVIACRKE